MNPFRRPKGPSGPEMRKAKPIRNPVVEYMVAEDGSALLEAPLSTHGNRFIAAMAKRMKEPVSKKIELEPVGALVWQLCDGEHTFEGIAKRLREDFKMNRLEAEAALAAFLQTLVRRRLVTIVIKGGS